MTPERIAELRSTPKWGNWDYKDREECLDEIERLQAVMESQAVEIARFTASLRRAYECDDRMERANVDAALDRARAEIAELRERLSKNVQ